MEQRYLQFRNWKTGELGRRVDVTGLNERGVERTLRGMLINIHDDWIVDDSAALSTPPQKKTEGE